MNWRMARFALALLAVVRLLGGASSLLLLRKAQTSHSPRLPIARTCESERTSPIPSP
jgi:hypothetical protein